MGLELFQLRLPFPKLPLATLRSGLTGKNALHQALIWDSGILIYRFAPRPAEYYKRCRDLYNQIETPVHGKCNVGEG